MMAKSILEIKLYLNFIINFCTISQLNESVEVYQKIMLIQKICIWLVILCNLRMYLKRDKIQMGKQCATFQQDFKSMEFRRFEQLWVCKIPFITLSFNPDANIICKVETLKRILFLQCFIMVLLHTNYSYVFPSLGLLIQYKLFIQ